MQLHLHGPFSEGQGSIDSHDWEASDVGCDVLWWSEHDFRLTGYQQVSHYGFEDWEEPLDRGEPWQNRLAKYERERKGLQVRGRPRQAQALFVDEPRREGEHALRLELTHPGPEFAPLRMELGTLRGLERRCLATGVTLRLALFPLELGPDARAVVEVQLSEHAPREGLGLEPCLLRYLIAPGGGTPHREGAAWVVPLDCRLGEWNELVLPLTRDAVRGFPAFPGEDNALFRLELGLDARAGAQAVVVLDDLSIEQQLRGPDVFARQRELLDQVGAAYPDLRQLQGLEVSYDSRHLNLFCAETPLPDYEELASRVARDADHPELLDARAFRAEVLSSVVARTHERGGLVSYNHPFGATYEESERRRDNDQQLEILLRSRAEGADLLEVGYRDRGGATLEDHLWLWDQAALAGLPLVGVGVSDSHGGPQGRWRGTPNNLVSWIYADSPRAADLIAGLRAGRVFFGDLERFDGELDLECPDLESSAGPGAARMGARCITDAPRVNVVLVARGLRGGERLVVVESGRHTLELECPPGALRHALELELPPAGPAFVRFELHDAQGPIALSNPIRFERPDAAR